MIKRLIKQRFRIRQLWNRFKYEIGGNKRLVSYDPIWLSIYPTRRCTYSCSFCTNHANNGSGKVKEAYQLDSQDMSLETFKAIIDKYENAMVCTFCGVGEPLLVSNIFQMITYANDRRMITELVTNGSLLNDKSLRSIMDIGLQRVNISLNESDPVKHQLEVGTKKPYLKIIKKYIFQLTEMKKAEASALEIKISRVLTKSSLSRAREFIETGIQLGVDRVVFHNLIYSGIDEYDLTEIIFDTEKNRLFFTNLNKEYSSKINIDFPTLIKKDDIKPNCEWFWKNLSIDGGGNIGSCGRFFTPSRDYGKFEEKNIWNSKYFVGMRDRFIKNNLLEYCKYCVENSNEK